MKSPHSFPCVARHPAALLSHGLILSLLLAFSAMILPPTFGAASEDTKPDYTEALRLIEGWLDAQRDYEQLPGLSAGVVQDQTLIWSKGYGVADRETKAPSRPDTIYSICSISKLFTAVAIMQLYDAGKLRLDDRIQDLLPGYNLAQAFPDSGPITVRALLSHSAGLPRESDYPYWTGPDFPFPDRDAIRGRLGEQKTLYPASTYNQYSNLGLTLLGEIVAARSGQSFELYVEANILQPLRLAKTRTELPAALRGREFATGYGSTKRDGTRDPQPFFQARGSTPAFGFSSTVEDLGRFASWQFRLLEQGGTEILRVATLREMHRVQWMDPDWKLAWGLGFAVKEEAGRSIVGHTGSCPGYRTHLDLDPKEKLATIVMINASGTFPNRLAASMRAILKKSSDPGPKIKAPGEIDLLSYAGRYNQQPWWGEMMVTPWKGGLATLALPSNDPKEDLILWQHVQGDTFRRIRTDKSLGEELRFERDSTRRITRVWRHSNFSNRLP
jgi:CubicO group peptidase (beta-lactamase class C family)